MTSKDPSGPIIHAAFTLDTRHDQHPCLSCRQYCDPTDPDRPITHYTPLDFAPCCIIDAHWFMLKRPDWSCSGFDREPGDQ